MDRVVSIRETKISPEDKARLLTEYVKKEKCVPLPRVEYQGLKIGRWWYNMKNYSGPNHALYKSTLISITLLREDMERYLSNRDTKNL